MPTGEQHAAYIQHLVNCQFEYKLGFKHCPEGCFVEHQLATACAIWELGPSQEQ